MTEQNQNGAEHAGRLEGLELIQRLLLGTWTLGPCASRHACMLPCLTAALHVLVTSVCVMTASGAICLRCKGHRREPDRPTSLPEAITTPTMSVMR
jgi:hypothetical protein